MLSPVTTKEDSMWRTGSSFDGEAFRLSDPSLYRVLDAVDDGVADLVSTEPTTSPRRRRRGRDRRSGIEDEWREDPW